MVEQAPSGIARTRQTAPAPSVTQPHPTVSGRARVLTGAAALILAGAAGTAPTTPAELETFEAGVPRWASARSGVLSLATDRYKDGRRSLQWSLGQGDALTISRPFAYAPFVGNPVDQRRSGFAFWIYNPVRSAGHFSFAFYRGGVRASDFEMKADFTGWRAAVLSFETDMRGTPVVGMDRLVIRPPQALRSGKVLFDQMAFGVLVDPRHPAADYQLPHLNPTVLKKANAHWTAVLHYDRLLASLDTARRHGRSVPSGDGDVAEIQRRIDADLLTGRPSSLAEIERGLRDFQNAGGSFKALAQTSLQWEMYKASGVDEQTLATLRATSFTWRELGKYLRSVALAYRRTDSPEARQRLKAIFLELYRHQTEQGLVRGSGQGVLHHQGYQLGDWSEALFLMRGALGSEADTARQAIAWFAGLGRIYEPARPETDFNADVMNTLLQPMLFSILMDVDERRRQDALRRFADWTSASTLASPGTGGGLKPDGSMFHHSQHYVAYGNGALTGLAGTLYYLAGSRYSISPAAHDRARRAVLVTRLLSNHGRMLMSLSGRHLDGEQAVATAPFRYLALAGGVNDASGPDREMAGAFLRLMAQRRAGGETHSGRAETGDLLAVARLRASGITPEADPAGSWVLNYSSLLLHRRDGWLVGARGYSRYLVGNEAYEGKNLFGRYVNYGSLEILPADPEHRSFAVEGWDWIRWPGTTAIRVPLEKLRAQVAQVDEVAGVEEMLLSEQTFSGALDLRGRTSMFAMKLQGHWKYGDDLAARKSYFLFEDRVIALGSSISSGDRSSPVQTTVFQHRISAGPSRAQIDGVPAEEEAGENSVKLAGWHAGVDEAGNGVCLAPDQTVAFRRGEQASLDESGLRRTRGRFSTLVIDHGRAPSAAAYEYALLVAGGRERTRAFCAAMRVPRDAPYVVVERSNRAHVVRDVATATTGYALFEAGAVAADGLLESVSAPSLLMIRAGGDRVTASFLNPDLNLYEGRDASQYDAAGKLRERSVYALPWRMKPSRPLTTTVVFKGDWRLEAPNSQTRLVYDRRRASTSIAFTTVDAAPIQFTLVKR